MEIPENLIAKDIKEILDLVKSGLKMKGKVSVEFSARIFFRITRKQNIGHFCLKNSRITNYQQKISQN